jgi:hypothetical protein
LKGSNIASRPLIIPTYQPGAYVRWMHLTTCNVQLANFTIYHTYNASSSSVGYSYSLIFLYSDSSVIQISDIIFTTQNPGMVILNPIFVNYMSGSISITSCDFQNISFQASCLLYDDYYGQINFTNSTFRCAYIVLYM